MKNYRINEEIRGQKVNIIDAQGQIKLVPTYAALNMAKNENLDLVEMNMQDGIALCKLMDYGKFKYEQTKKLHDSKKAQPKHEVKEIRLSPRIEKHDIEIKLEQVKKFLDKNFKVQVSVQFRGRENTYREIGYDILSQFRVEGANITGPKSEGNTIVMVLTKGNNVCL